MYKDLYNQQKEQIYRALGTEVYTKLDTIIQERLKFKEQVDALTIENKDLKAVLAKKANNDILISQLKKRLSNKDTIIQQLQGQIQELTVDLKSERTLQTHSDDSFGSIAEEPSTSNRVPFSVNRIKPNEIEEEDTLVERLECAQDRHDSFKACRIFQQLGALLKS